MKPEAYYIPASLLHDFLVFAQNSHGLDLTTLTREEQDTLWKKFCEMMNK